MKQYKKTITNKLFYKKYPYKIYCFLEGAFILRSIKFNSDNSYKVLFPESWRATGYVVKNFVKKHGDIVFHPDVMRSISHRSFTLYIKDKEIYNLAVKQLSTYILEIAEPSNDNELELLESDCKKVLCNSLPKGKYQYKIFFKSMPLKTRESFLRWASSFQDNEVSVPPNTKSFFSGKSNRGIYNEHYAYVRDEGIKMLALLASQGYIRRIEEFVLRSQINNEILQEQTCQL